MDARSLQPPVARRVAAPVLEVFASIQGEGRHAGEPQTFLRLRGCPLRCAWCDTPGSWKVGAEPEARLRVPVDGDAAATRDRHEPALATPFVAGTWIAAVEPGPPRTVSVTGGEPLLWPEFVLELATFCGPRRLHLETAGAHPDALARVLPVVDHVSLDLKLPADLAAPVAVDEADPAPVPADTGAWADARRSSLALLREHDAALKLVVAGGRAPADFAPLLDDAREFAPRLPVYLQPVTPFGGVSAPSSELLLGLVEEALERELDVRVVPQLHPILELP
jgi:organic radical activating enzyme